MTKEEYFESVECIAQDIVDRILEEAKSDFDIVDSDDEDDFYAFFKEEFVYVYDYSQQVHEAVDSSSWIIWSTRNVDVVSFTNHIDAWTEFGTLPKGNPILGIAYSAMCADVRDTIERLVEAM